MKKLLIFIIPLIVLIVVYYNINNKINENNKISEKIVKTIDDNCKLGDSYNISMKEITDFNWDKMVVFDVGSSNDEISEALGVQYEDSVDLMSGMVFVYHNKIVYSERLPYDPEQSNKLWFHIDNKPGEPSYWTFTPDDAILVGTKTETDGNFYYEIKPIKTD